MRTTQTWWGWGLVVALGAVGCLDSHEPTDPVPFASFCDDFFDALCGPIEACGCAESSVLACRAEQRALCAGVPSAALLASVEAGRVRYDAERAAELLARMRARESSCQGFVDALDWSVRDLLSLGGVFEGTVEAGGACEPLGFELISECRLGGCAPVGDAHVCLGAVGAGERCDAVHTCADLDGRLTFERGIDRLTLRCVPDAPDAEVGTCVAWVDEGGACEGDAACWSGVCRGGRCAVRADDEPCSLARECASGNCHPSEHVCRPGDAPEGAPCADAAACASHVCLDGTCAPAGCGTF